MPYQFRLPKIDDLTPDQQAALFTDNPFHLKGGPGTGKTVVSLWRHIENWQRRGRQSLLLTYTKSLEYYLRSSARRENPNASKNINRTFRWTYGNSHRGNFDEIIVDEAQDVSLDRYKIINNHATIVSYGADQKQSLYTHGCSESQLEDLFANITYELYENFRNSKEIVRFVKSLFPNFVVNEESTVQGQKPKLVITDNDDKVKSVFRELIEDNPNTENMAILVPLQQDVERYELILKDIGATYSRYYHDGDEIGTIENIHLTTLKSSKGLEFDTVIIPDFHQYRDNIKNLYVVSENDYYVALTRTRRNLFLLCDTVPSGLHPNTYETITS